METNPVDSRIDRNRVADLLEIHRLKGLYCYHLDNKQWAAWGALFTRDAQLLSGTDVSQGVDSIVEYVIERLQAPKSVHHGHMPLIEFEGDNAARGIWAMTGIIDYGNDSVLYGFGHYNETYRRESGAWKFSSIHLTHLRVDIVPVRRESMGHINWDLTKDAVRS